MTPEDKKPVTRFPEPSASQRGLVNEYGCGSKSHGQLNQPRRMPAGFPRTFNFSAFWLMTGLTRPTDANIREGRTGPAKKLRD